ncbi:DUF6101 family protein [Pararhizobium mangrovi]|uniref:Uncharacterized protein n=1 Tax=Pararhizobium mangrovi TaxID=2590452 RepID=A0A506U0S7_9HYPH|nr:DUF6101 family protein [Pararhizobium mangrovi]TPW26209.1 hypothetical protein FJU11_15600 [Pararhizobium mangrovi]
MANTVFKPVWAGSELRLDPTRLPQEASFAPQTAGGATRCTLDERGVVMRKDLPQSGLPISIALPKHAFRGVAARAMDDGEGTVTVTLELLHDDPDLCVPLLVAHDLAEIAADWQSWSRLYGLPMLMVEADGVARPLVDQVGKVTVHRATPRRNNAFFTRRRPRLSMRRPVGDLETRMRIDGREIIGPR